MPTMSRRTRGFGLIETIVGVALFVAIGMTLYQTYASVLGVVQLARVRTAGVAILNEEMEIARNMPYDRIGTQTGIPKGDLLATKTRVVGQYVFRIDTTVRNIDDPFDGQAGSTTYNDLSPADSKLVEISVTCQSCVNKIPMSVSATTRIGPKNLESASTNGSLFINVIDANGMPVSGANVRVENASSSILINDTTNNSGVLQIIDAPPGVEAYQITVTKPGYTIARTYATGSSTAPLPVNPNPTVIAQTVTEITLAIDRESTLSVLSVREDCSPVPSIGFSLTGTRLISNAPSSVLKFDQSFTTDTSGRVYIPGLDWDTYTLGVTSGSYDIGGTIPLSPLILAPGAAQNLYLVMRDKEPRALLITVKDSTTGLPVAGATVELERSGATTTRVTGRGFLRQTDWSGGGGQATTTDVTKYWTDDGNIDVAAPAGDLKLLKVLGEYEPYGTLESSTFDTGSAANFYEFLATPISQPPEVGYPGIAFQIATRSNDPATTTWQYLGPDGTAASYYTPTSTTISAVHNGDRYLRYKVFLTTASTSYTPTLSEVAFTFTSSCVPPGQAYFSNLSSGTYRLVVTKPGYQQVAEDIVVGSNWEEHQVILSP